MLAYCYYKCNNNPPIYKQETYKGVRVIAYIGYRGNRVKKKLYREEREAKANRTGTGRAAEQGRQRL
jgi:hypothetical protein